MSSLNPVRALFLERVVNVKSVVTVPIDDVYIITLPIRA